MPGPSLSLASPALSDEIANASVPCTDDGLPAAKKERKEKVAFAMDFSEPPALSAKELFAAANPKSSITTAATRRPTARSRAASSSATAGEEDYTLPDDYHFNSQNLLRLFLKPKMTVCSISLRSRFLTYRP